MAKAFISYSRKDIEFAKRLTAELQKSEMDFWIDWEGIPPTVDWWKEIEKGIEEADIFLFLISPDSAKSKVCGQEIDTAVKNAKRIIPLIVRDIDGDETPKQLSHLNWIFFRESDNFDAAIKKLITAIRTDYEWVATHRRLQVKALDWERNGKERGFFLRGMDLLDAEQDLAINTSKDPHATDLQREFVFESRRATDRQRRFLTSISIAGLIALAALAIYGFDRARQATNNEKTAQENLYTAQTAQVLAQKNQVLAATNAAVAIANEEQAKQQAKISRSGELAAQSSELSEKSFLLSLLLGVEAFNEADTPRSRGNLLDRANGNPLLMQFLTNRTDSISGLAFSPKENILATAGCGNFFPTKVCNFEIVLWDVTKRKILGQPFVGHHGEVKDLTFSSDGKLLISAACGEPDPTSCTEVEIIFWDVKTQKIVKRLLKDQLEPTDRMYLSGDGRILALYMLGPAITLLDTANGTATKAVLDEVPGWLLNISDIAFSDDGRAIAACDNSTRLTVWNIKTQQIERQTTIGNSCGQITFSRDSKKLASSMTDGTIRLWNAETLEPLGLVSLPSGAAVSDLVFSPDDRFLASSGSDQNIILWDIEHSQAPNRILAGHADWVPHIDFSADGKTLASWSLDRSIGLWDISSIVESKAVPQPIARILTRTKYVPKYLRLSSSGKILVAVNNEGKILFWNTTTQRLMGEASENEIKQITDMIFSPDDKVLLLSGVDENRRGIVTFWNVSSQERLPDSIQGELPFIYRIAIGANGRTLITANQDGTITFWDTKQELPPKNLTVGKDGVLSVALSSDGHTMASGDYRNALVLWKNISTKPESMSLSGHTSVVYDIAFSPRGDMLATASNDLTVILWDIASGRILHQIPISNTGIPRLVTFSPDGSTLATVNSNSGIRLWDVGSGQAIGNSLRGDTSAISRDFTTFATRNFDGTILIWDMRPMSWKEIACQRAGRNFTRAEWTQYFPNEEYPASPEEATCPQWPLGQELDVTATPAP